MTVNALVIVDVLSKKKYGPLNYKNLRMYVCMYSYSLLEAFGGCFFDFGPERRGPRDDGLEA